MYNWHQLTGECLLSTFADVLQNAGYFSAKQSTMSQKKQTVDALSVLPPQAYEYAPDILYIAEGCEVRLLQNVNVAAVTCRCQSHLQQCWCSSIACWKARRYNCIITSFTAFQRFLEKNSASTRILPFPNQPSWILSTGNVSTLRSVLCHRESKRGS